MDWRYTKHAHTQRIFLINPRHRTRATLRRNDDCARRRKWDTNGQSFVWFCQVRFISYELITHLSIFMDEGGRQFKLNMVMSLQCWRSISLKLKEFVLFCFCFVLSFSWALYFRSRNDSLPNDTFFILLRVFLIGEHIAMRRKNVHAYMLALDI